VFKETPTEELTEANSHAKLSCSNLLLNDVICKWFSDKDLSTLATAKKSSNADCLYLVQKSIMTLVQNALAQK